LNGRSRRNKAVSLNESGLPRSGAGSVSPFRLSQSHGGGSLLSMATSEELFREAMALAPEVRAELAERLIGSLAEDVSPEITSAQLAEVKRRIAEVESGKVELVPGDEVLTQARRLLTDRTPTS